MGSMNSINGLVSGSVDYSKLVDIADGKYNKGEITFKNGLLGGFGKVNNHVGALSGSNTTVTTEKQNLLTRAAVLKAILTWFGDSETEKNDIEFLMNVDLDLDNYIDEENVRGKLSSLKNPFLADAFKFLIMDGNKEKPLSRDEMRLLIKMLQDGDDIVKQKNAGNTANINETRNGYLAKLGALRDFKRGLSSDVESVKELLKGFSVENIDAVKKSRVSGVTVNALQSRLEARFKALAKAKHFGDMVYGDETHIKSVARNVTRAAADIPEWKDGNVGIIAKKLADGLGMELLKKHMPSNHEMFVELAELMADAVVEGCKQAKAELGHEGKAGLVKQLKAAVLKNIREPIDYHVRDSPTWIESTYTSAKDGTRVLHDGDLNVTGEYDDEYDF